MIQKDKQLAILSFLNNRPWIIGSIILLVIFAVFSPSLKAKFVNYDDPAYVVNNTDIQKIDLHMVRWIFLNHFGNWHPLTWLSHALDYQIWGLNPYGHHLTSMLIHSINVFFSS